jgi:hypothetical protein
MCADYMRSGIKWGGVRWVEVVWCEVEWISYKSEVWVVRGLDAWALYATWIGTYGRKTINAK